MRFREWLITEDEGDGGEHDGSHWDLIIPTRADEFPGDSINPRRVKFFQWKLKRGEEIGRPLHNIDNKEFQKRDYRSIEATTAPDCDEDFWTHKDDGSSPSTKVVKVDKKEFSFLGYGKNADDVKLIDKYNFVPNELKHSLWSSYDKAPDANLEKTFGDEISGDFPHIDNLKKFDDDWTKPEHRSMSESFRDWLEFTTGGGDFGGHGGYGSVMHGGIFAKPGGHLNSGNGGIKSKYQQTDGDETNPEVKTNVYRDFGFTSRKSKRAARERPSKTIDKRRQDPKLVAPRPYT